MFNPNDHVLIQTTTGSRYHNRTGTIIQFFDDTDSYFSGMYEVKFDKPLKMADDVIIKKDIFYPKELTQI